jgi:hypothetical protein
MKYFNPETKTYKLFKALKNGKAVTESYARNKLGIENLSAEVSRVRQGGYAVYRQTRVAGNNVKVAEYTLGAPSREIIALGYKAKALGITL